MNNIKQIFRKNKYWIVLCGFVVLFGCFLVYNNFLKPTKLGDPATFAVFGCNISRGEVVYKDFYHFRTPGEYFTSSILAKIKGCGMNSLMITHLATEFIAVPLILIGSIYIFDKRKIKLAWLVYLATLVNPLAGQFRIALGFLSMIFMVKFFRADNKNRETKILYVAGLLTGLTFLFGQDIAILAGFLFTILSVFDFLKFGSAKRQDWLKLATNFLRFGVGFLAGVAPLLIYLIVNGILIKGLYYILYYAIFLQPGGMDIPYPLPSTFSALIFYIPILILVISYVAIIASGKLNWPLLIVTLWAILRFISAAGRSDEGHLVFAIFPDFILLIWLAFEAFKDKISISKRDIVLAALFLASFLGAIFVKSFLLFLVAIGVLVSIAIAKKEPAKKHNLQLYSVIRDILVVATVIFAWQMVVRPAFELYGNTITGIKYRSQQIANRIPDYYKRIENTINQKNPEYIFAFPVHPYFYLNHQHATPFMTFEPQTTKAEQIEAIENLKKNRPEVVIFDPIQAYNMGKSVDLITNYILNNYKIESIEDSEEVLWVMVPRDEVTNFNFISLNIKKFSSNNSLISVENRSQKIRFGLMQLPKTKTTIDNFDKITNLRFEVVFAEKAKMEIYFSNGKTQKIDLVAGKKYHISGAEIDRIEVENLSSSDLILKDFLAN